MKSYVSFRSLSCEVEIDSVCACCSVGRGIPRFLISASVDVVLGPGPMFPSAELGGLCYVVHGFIGLNGMVTVGYLPSAVVFCSPTIIFCTCITTILVSAACFQLNGGSHGDFH